MDKKNILPYQTQPVMRVNQGTNPIDLTSELSEEVLGTSRSGAYAASAVRQPGMVNRYLCSYEGDDFE